MPDVNLSSIEVAANLGRRALVGVDLESLISEAMQTITATLNVEFSSFLELTPAGEGFFAGGVGWQDGVVGSASIEMSGQSVSGYVVRTQTAVAIDDLQNDRRFTVSALIREHGIVSVLLVPVYGLKRPLGVVGACSSKCRSFTADEMAWLQIVANVLSSQIEQRSLSQRNDDIRLLKAEQMMAIGQVAAGVAHELRNPLTSIKGLVQINLRELEARELPTTDLEVIEHEIRRMERTLQTFLDFARAPKPDRRLLDLTTIVDRVLALVSGRARKQLVSLQFLRPPTPITAKVDQDQMQQLLLNLVLNALDAMPQGGTIEIDLHPPRDAFIELYVRDTGPGIAPHILPKVFETFVSSKETGIGLGLPLSRRIAEDHGGGLTAYNLPTSGACFLLRLPVYNQSP